MQRGHESRRVTTALEPQSLHLQAIRSGRHSCDHEMASFKTKKTKNLYNEPTVIRKYPVRKRNAGCDQRGTDTDTTKRSDHLPLHPCS